MKTCGAAARRGRVTVQLLFFIDLCSHLFLDSSRNFLDFYCHLPIGIWTCVDIFKIDPLALAPLQQLGQASCGLLPRKQKAAACCSCDARNRLEQCDAEAPDARAASAALVGPHPVV